MLNSSSMVCPASAPAPAAIAVKPIVNGSSGPAASESAPNHNNPPTVPAAAPFTPLKFTLSLLFANWFCCFATCFFDRS